MEDELSGYPGQYAVNDVSVFVHFIFFFFFAIFFPFSMHLDYTTTINPCSIYSRICHSLLLLAAMLLVSIIDFEFIRKINKMWIFIFWPILCFKNNKKKMKYYAFFFTFQTLSIALATAAAVAAATTAKIYNGQR